MSLDALPDDLAALRAIILAQQQKIAGMEASSRAYEALIQALKLTIARMKRQRYRASSEKIDRPRDRAAGTGPRRSRDGRRRSRCDPGERRACR